MKFFLIVILSISALGKAQEAQSSITFVQTCYHGHQCFSVNKSSFIFYNPDSHELKIVVDFSKFRVGDETLDEWIDDLDDSQLVFIGHLETNDLLLLSQHHHKTMNLQGIVIFNGVKNSHSVELTLFEVPREGKLFLDRQNDYFDRVLVSLQFGFYPREFKINKKPHHMRKKIIVAVHRGYLNPLRSGMDHWIDN